MKIQADHDIHDYFYDLSARIKHEYTRISRNSRKDPGTAGDEGEENWAELLRDWLPKDYTIVTKGNLINSHGIISPQIDIIVLKPTYPNLLINRKKYFIDLVSAVFECKLTLRNSDIYKSFETCSKIKKMATPRFGTPYKEMSRLPLFGILSHSSDRKRKSINLIEKAIQKADLSFIKHPSETPDLICIADLATWAVEKMPLDPNTPPSLCAANKGVKHLPSTLYACFYGALRLDINERHKDFYPIGKMLEELYIKLAWEDIRMRDMASFFMKTGPELDFNERSHYWNLDIFDKDIKGKIKWKYLDADCTWNEWATVIE
jgi:hypothetical protein